MANIEKRQRDGGTSYRVRYRTPAGAQRSKTFARKADAERFRATVESAKNTGTYIDPARAGDCGGVGREVARGPGASQAVEL
jgi:hypothetical protein